MIYQAYQARADLLAPFRAFAGMTAGTLGLPLPGLATNPVVRTVMAAHQLLAETRLTHERPGFGITRVEIGNRALEVREVHRSARGDREGLVRACHVPPSVSQVRLEDSTCQ